jgi:hypothetical protein
VTQIFGTMLLKLTVPNHTIALASANRNLASAVPAR